MLRIAVENEAETIEINGTAYTLQLSDADILDIAVDAARRIAMLHIRNGGEVRAFLGWCADRIDEMLGKGAMKEITNGQPVRFETCTKVLNAIIEDRTRAHGEYIREAYGV